MRAFRLALLVLVLAGLGLAACGRRGDLQPPPGAKGEPKNEPFILDPLL